MSKTNHLLTARDSKDLQGADPLDDCFDGGNFLHFEASFNEDQQHHAAPNQQYPTSIMIDTSQHTPFVTNNPTQVQPMQHNNVQYRQEDSSDEEEENNQESQSNSQNEQEEDDEEQEEASGTSSMNDDIIVQRPDQRIEMLLNEMRSEGEGSVIMEQQ